MAKQGTTKTKADKSALFEDHRTTRKVEVPPYGTFTIRALTRKQAMALGDIKGAAEIEVAIIAQGVVGLDGEDLSLSFSDVRRWQEAATGMALEPLSDAIAKLSGLHEEVERETVKEFPDRT